MHSVTSFLLVGVLAVHCVFALPEIIRTKRVQKVKISLDSFIATESPTALSKLLCNIGSAGSCASGAAPGIVIASPTKTDPDYFFTWTRDSALTFKCIVDTFITNYNSSLQIEIQNYIIAQARLQTVYNPSGDLLSGTGLGEPKFNVDETAFTGSWGRPQRDGPALRAIALIAYAKWLIANGYNSTAATVVWPIIQNDLNYVTQYWGQTGFDLWEEVSGYSFFTVAAQYRALVEGDALAVQLGKTCNNCIAQAPQILCYLQNFWGSSNFIIANLNTNNGRTGKDSNTLLGSIHTFDPNATCDATTFQPCSDRALANHKAVTDSFRSEYTLNSGIPQGTAVAVGRYAEDTYMGGNPWYLNTLAAAELLYDALYQWNRIGSITITTTSLSFWQDIYPSAAVGTYASSTSIYTALYNAVKTYADGYFNNVVAYTPSSGTLAEQYSRNNGAPLSANDLTWSYAAFLTAAARRAGIVPASWGSSSGNNIPSSCSMNGAPGSYTSATATSFPPSQTPVSRATSTTASTLTATTVATTTLLLTSSSTSAACSTPVAIVAVTFHEIVTTAYGQTIKIVGSIPALGNWNTDAAIPLSPMAYTSSNHLWFVTISLPAGTSFQYKFIIVSPDGGLTWESDPNLSYTVPMGCEGKATVIGTWDRAMENSDRSGELK